jgi:hypothetical protein
MGDQSYLLAKKLVDESPGELPRELVETVMSHFRDLDSTVSELKDKLLDLRIKIELNIQDGQLKQILFAPIDPKKVYEEHEVAQIFDAMHKHRDDL